jgi:anaerobic selenocysteine-containing dehydrogenase
VVLAAAGAPNLDAACLGDPAVTAPAGDPREFPLAFLPYAGVTHVAGGPQSEQLSEFGDALLGTRWGAPVELNPGTAAAAGIRDGDRVVVESVAGRLETRAYLFEGIPPDAARMAIGAGHRHGAGHTGGDANPRDIVSADVTTTLGRPALAGVRVRVRKVAS